MIFRPAMIGAVCFLMAGCEATIQGRPQAQYDLDRKPLTDIVLAHRLNETTVKAALESTDNLTRNRVVFARMAEIDALYNSYEIAVLAETKQSGFALSFGALLAGLAGGFATGEASQIFSLIGGGIDALQTSYDKELLAESTIQAFISQMRAGRAQVRTELYERLARPATDYPIEAALTDLERYRQAGTLATAIAGITQQAAMEESFRTDAASAATESFLAKATISREVGPEVSASDTQRSRVDRLDAVAARIKIPAQVSSEKLVALLKEPPTDDPDFKAALEEIRDRTLSRRGASELTAELISAITRSRIATAILEARGDPIVDQLEKLFPGGS